MRPFEIACFALGLSTASTGCFAAPSISAVVFAMSGATYKAVISGSGFGTSPVTLPCNSCNINEFSVLYYPNANNYELPNITKWTDSKIVVNGIAGLGGSAVQIAVRNDALGEFGVWAGNLPSPKIASISISGIGQSMQITVTGSGFGAAPNGVPGNTDIPYFAYSDWVVGNQNSSNTPWRAGWNSGSGGSTSVTLNYASWSDTKIVIDGFGSGYGGSYTASHGDPFSVTIFAPPGLVAGATGPQTSKAGVLP